jgi:hypothetical protein
VYEAGDRVDVNGALNLGNNGVTGGNWILNLVQGGDGLADGGSLALFTYDTLIGTPNLNPTINLIGFDFAPTL